MLGSAKNLFDDLEKAQKFGDFDVIAVKQAGIYYPGPLKAWINLHPSRIPEYEGQRRQKKYPMEGFYQVIHTTGNLSDYPNARYYKHTIEGVMKKSAGSGMAGVIHALRDMKYRGVILCGIPMSPMARVDHNMNWDQENADTYRLGIEPAIPIIKPYVRSMSGWTRDQFGEPDEKWLDEEVAPWAAPVLGENPA